MTRAVLFLAFVEYFLPFRKPRQAPGGRDFLWLTLLLALVQALGLLLTSTEEGVLDQSVDIFLGDVEGYGIPVWVIPNYLADRANPRLIDHALIEAFEAEGYQASPYREMPNTGVLDLPGPEVWRGGRTLSIEELENQTAADSPTVHKGDGDEEALFFGWAVDPAGPNWPSGHRYDAGGEIERWQLVFNRSLVTDATFSMEAYLEAIRGKIPDAEFANQESVDSVQDLTRIWLNLSVHRERLVPFDLVWVDSLGLGQPIAYLFPLQLLDGIREARRNAGVCLFPETGLGVSNRVLLAQEPLRRSGEMDAEDRRVRIEKLAAVLGGEVLKRGPLYSIDFRVSDRFARGEDCDPGVQEALFNQLLTEAGVELQVRESIAGDPMIVEENRMLVPCDLISDRKRIVASEPWAALDGRCMESIERANTRNGYRRLFVYVSDREDLRRSVEEITLLEGGRVQLMRVYRDALERFSFLSEMIATLRAPYGIFLFVFLVMVLIVQLGTLIGHRHLRYGVMLSRGMSWLQIHTIVGIQIVLASVVSLLMGSGGVLLARHEVNRLASYLQEDYRFITQGKALDLLPLSLESVGLALLLSTVGAVAFGVIHLALIGIRPGNQLENLMRD